MTAITVSVATDMSSDAGFRVWGAAFGTQLAACGWVQTGDTGQINWASVTKPVASATVAGYEIWRMNDSLQGTAPIFIKIEYGTATTATTSALWLTLGFATNGSGTLSSTNVSTRVTFITALNSATAYPWKISGTSGRIGFVESWNQASNYRYFFVERTHNNDGTDSALGALMVFGSGTSSNYAQLVTASGSLPVQTRYTACVGNLSSAATITSIANQYSSNLYFAPVRLFGMGESTPMSTVCGYFSTDMTTGNTATVTNWDGTTSMTIFATGLAPSYFGLSTQSIAMRFD